MDKLNVFENYSDYVVALALFLNNCTIEEMKSKTEDEIIDFLDDAQKLYDDGDYEVLNDEEADERREEELDSYIEECILPEIPEYLQNYFDEESFKRDCSFDGRGNQLSQYDGNENEQEYLNETYYIYRQN